MTPTVSSTVSVFADVPPAPNCDLVAQPMACPGVLEKAFINRPNYTDLQDALTRLNNGPLLVPGIGKGRRKKCSTNICGALLYIQPYVNKYSRWFDFEAGALPQLPMDKAIIIGALDFPTRFAHDDERYKIGRHLETERVFIIAYRDEADGRPDPTAKNYVIARWRMFKVANDRTVTGIAEGKIRRCSKDHDEYRNKVAARFLGCEGESAYRFGKALSGHTMTTLMETGACPVDVGRDSTKAANCDRDSNRISALAKLPKVDGFQSLTAESIVALLDMGDESGALYWFSCANGCCSASDY